MPWSWTRRASDASTSSAETGSSDDVGSSSTRPRGAAVKAAPMATRWRWPPESVVMARWRSACRFKVSSTSSTLPAHCLGVHAEVLHGVGELVFDRVRDKARIGVLADVADGIGEVTGTIFVGAATVDGYRSVETATGEVGDETVHAAEQRRLAGASRSDDQGQMTLFDREVHVLERRCRRARVGDRDAVEGDHAIASCGLARIGPGIGATAEGTVAARIPARARTGPAGSRKRVERLSERVRVVAACRDHAGNGGEPGC